MGGPGRQGLVERRRMRSARHVPLLVAAAALCLGAAVAEAQTPLPAKDPARSVYDAADVIDPMDEATMEHLHTELVRKTGAMIVVVTVARLEDETISELAVRVGQDWGVGREKEEEGLVIAFSRDDRKLFVATGYGSEGYLPDGRVGAIRDQYALPLLRQNEFSRGLLQVDAALAQVIAGEHGVQLTGAPPVDRQRGRRQGKAPPLWLIIGGVLVFGYLAVKHPMLLMFFLMSGGRGGGFGGGGFGGGGGHGGFGGGGFGGGGAGGDF